MDAVNPAVQYLRLLCFSSLLIFHRPTWAVKVFGVGVVILPRRVWQPNTFANFTRMMNEDDKTHQPLTGWEGR